MTPNMEDYLKCIHELQERGLKITNKAVAERMAVSAPSVSEMLKKLVADAWLTKEKSLGYVMTAKAQEAVSRLYRKHRLIEVFLINHLHYNSQAIHEEAEVLEHSVTDYFIDQLEKLLDFPQTCLHGGSIPRAGAALVETFKTPLASIQKAGSYQLTRIQDNKPLLDYLDKHNLTIGNTFELLEHDSFTQTWNIRLRDRELAIPAIVAEQIYVESI